LPQSVLFAATINCRRSPMPKGIMKKHTAAGFTSNAVRRVNNDMEIDGFAVLSARNRRCALERHGPQALTRWKQMGADDLFVL